MPDNARSGLLRLLVWPARLLGYDPRNAELKGLLNQACAFEAGRLPDDQIDFVRECIEAGEFGLAREQLMDALADRDLRPRIGTAEALNKAGCIMGRGQT